MKQDDEWVPVDRDEFLPLVPDWLDDKQLWSALIRCARGKLDRGPAAPPKPYRPDGIAAKASRAAIRRRVLGGAGHEGL